MKHLLSRLSEIFPFVHTRPATEEDFFACCANNNFDVVFSAELSDGLCILYKGKYYIFLNDKLTGWRRLHVMFHELAHCLFHVPSQSGFAAEWFSGLAKAKHHREAEAVAAYLLLPIYEMENALIEGAGCENDELAELIALRLELASRYKK